MNISATAKYSFRIRTRSGSVVENLLIYGKDEQDAERRATGQDDGPDRKGGKGNLLHHFYYRFEGLTDRFQHPAHAASLTILSGATSRRYDWPNGANPLRR